MLRSRQLLWLAAAASLAACPRPRPETPAALTLSVPYEVDTIDPHARNRLSNFALLSHLYEPLVTADAAMTIRPCLAERWENPDLVTWIFHLRKGALFHDGSALDADDVVASFQRLLGSRGLEMAAYVANVTAVRALTPSAVELKTKRPMAILLNQLRFILIVPKEATGEALRARPNGTGPYTLAAFTPGAAELVMTRNARYWGEAPAFAEARLQMGRSPEQALQDLVGGRSAFVQCSSRALEETAKTLPQVRVLRHNSIFVKYLGYDLANETTPFSPEKRNPFRDVRVRRAVSLAVDRPALVSRLSTYAVPANQPVPPFIFGFNPSLPEARHDLAEARRLLAEAGYPHGFEVTLHVRRLFGEAARLVKEMLAAAGMRVTVLELPDSEFFEIVGNHRASFFLNRFGCPTGDASDTLDNAFHSIDRERHLGENNDGQYVNRDLDALMEESVGILEMERRRAMLQRIMAMTMEDQAWVPLYVDQDVYGVSRSLAWQPRNDNFVLAQEIRPAR